MTKEQFSKIMFAMSGNFGATIQPATLDLWFVMFRDDGVAYLDLAAAAQRIIRTKTDSYGRMPTYAEILTEIRGAVPRVEDRARAEAGAVIEHLRAVGATCDLVSADPVTARLMSTRWPYRRWAASVKEQDLTWWARDFVEAYRSERAVSDNGRLLPPPPPEAVKKLLPGIGNMPAERGSIRG